MSVDHPVYNLPAQPTPFIGREAELNELKSLLGEADCRLLTLVGPGGSGKTRLAIEAARQRAGAFADGVHFVPLQPVGSVDLLVPAIADSIEFPLRGQGEPQAQLLRYLSGKHLLLVLDNFEHLVPASDLLSEMLAAAPRLTLVVTTREALNLGEEWVFPVPGLRFPQDRDIADPESYDAVRLFVERARRVKRDYSPDADWAVIGRLCRLLQGMPLAVELAAAWIKVLPCEEIVAEVERNLDFLATRLRNVPERHRSVRAVFEESWSLLSDDERAVFERLAVFRGSFAREAAETVAGASLALLSTLVDKSLLKPLPEGRYLAHELLRQYALEKLAESPEAVATAHNSHSAYYTDLLRRQTPDLLGGRQVEAGAVVEAEMDNIRAAWQWAGDQASTESIRETVHALAQCWQFKSRYVEAATALEGALRRLTDKPPSDEIDLTLAEVLVELAWFYIRLGRLEEAEGALRRSQSIYHRLDEPPAPRFATDPRLGLGIIATIRGEYAEAARLGEEARLASEARGNPSNREVACYVLARAALLQGKHEAARECAQQACDLATELGDRWFLAYCLIELGNVACGLGDLAAAQDYYQASYDLRREFEDPEGMAIALTYLGEVALQQRTPEPARELYQQAVSLYRGIQDRGGLASALGGMAKAAAAVGDYEQARGSFAEGLGLAADIRHVPQILSLVAGVAEMLARAGDREGAGLLLSLAAQHPGSDHETRSRAQRLAGEANAQPPSLDIGAAMSTLRRSLDLATDMGIGPMLEAALATAEGTRGVAAAYPDELTEREVEVLRLIAKGRSNREIADELFITTNTVANHVKNILSKTQSANRTEAAAYAIEKQLA